MNGEPFVQFIVRVQHQALPLRSFFAQSEQSGVLVPFEETRHFAIGQQRVHSLEKAAVHHVGLVEEEDDLLAFAAGTTEQLTKIVIEVRGRVFVVNLRGRETTVGENDLSRGDLLSVERN